MMVEREDAFIKQCLDKNSKLWTLIKFMKENEDCNKKYLLAYCHQVKLFASAKEKIRFLFIQSLKAAGGSNLTRVGKTSKQFYLSLEKLNNNPKISTNDFLMCFGVPSFSELFKKLVDDKKTFSDFGNKKCALFFRNMYFIKEDIFSDPKNFKESDLKIPFDIVISIMLNKILKLEGKEQFTPERDFNQINELSKKYLEKDYMIIEDLWYWGYFNTKGKRNERTLEFNEDKYYSDLLFYPDKKCENKLMEFSNLCHKLGIK